MSDIDERLEKEILHAFRKSFDSQQAGINANFLMDIQREIERLRADLAAVTAERDALAARLAPVDDEALVEIVAKVLQGGYETEWSVLPEEWKNDWRRDARVAIAAIRPHIEAAALSDLVEFSKQKSWSLNYKRPFYCDDDDQEQCWIVYEEIGPINDRDWNVIGKGETAAEAIAAALKN